MFDPYQPCISPTAELGSEYFVHADLNIYWPCCSAILNEYFSSCKVEHLKLLNEQ